MAPKYSLVGNVYNRWTVLGFTGGDEGGRSKWWCRCTCGSEKAVDGNNLKSGASKSCGCLLREVITKHGCWATKEYATWEGIKQRCLNPKSQVYEYYGGRGITICDRWKNFEYFLADVGKKPEPTKDYSLDRINNEMGYEPGNVRWVIRSTQCQNRRKKPTSYQVILLNQRIKQLEDELHTYKGRFGVLDAA